MEREVPSSVMAALFKYCAVALRSTALLILALHCWPLESRSPSCAVWFCRAGHHHAEESSMSNCIHIQPPSSPGRLLCSIKLKPATVRPYQRVPPVVEILLKKSLQPRIFLGLCCPHHIRSEWRWQTLNDLKSWRSFQLKVLSLWPSTALTKP